MNDIRYLWVQNKVFFIPCMCFWAAGMFLWLFYNDIELSYYISHYLSPCQLKFWHTITYMGGAVFYTAITIIGYFFSKRFSAYTAISGVVITALIPLLKSMVSTPRPMVLFSEMGLWDTISTHITYPMMTNGSFPSGHTITAFTLFCMLSFFTPYKYCKILFFICAAAVGYSRIYMMQHFFADVYAGSIIGVMVAVFIYIIIHRHISLHRKI